METFIDEIERIPFDDTDAINLTLRKFRTKIKTSSIYVCIYANENGLILGSRDVTYSTLAQKYEIWNETLELWQPCNKVA